MLASVLFHHRQRHRRAAVLVAFPILSVQLYHLHIRGEDFKAMSLNQLLCFLLLAFVFTSNCYLIDTFL